MRLLSHAGLRRFFAFFVIPLLVIPLASTGCQTISAAELGDGILGEEYSRIPTPVYNANPNGAAVQHWGQEWRIGTCTTGSGPRVETNTLQKYTDHAAYTNVTTPAP